MSLLTALGLPSPLHEARGAAASAGKSERLVSAAADWREVHKRADAQIATLKAAVGSHYATAHPEVLREIERGAAKLDAVLDNVDHELADAMTAAAAGLGSGDTASVAHARGVLTRYIQYVASEPLIAHMDRNPFGVSMGLKDLLRDGLTAAARAIG